MELFLYGLKYITISVASGFGVAFLYCLIKVIVTGEGRDENNDEK